MTNFIGAIVFCVVAFGTGLSWSFKLLSKIVDENKLFTSLKRAILTYAFGIGFASIFTVVSFIGVCNFQNFVH